MSELIPLVAGILRLPPDEVHEETGTATTQAWSSLRHVEIIASLERTYGIHFTPREARTGRSVGRLRELLAAKGVRA